MNVKQVIVIRKDLNMRKGKMVSQGAHASLGALLTLFRKQKVEELPGGIMEEKQISYKYSTEFGEDSVLSNWLNGIFTKICVYVNSEEELNKIYDNAVNNNIPAVMITDRGLTEFNRVPTTTCIGIGPYVSEEIDKITGHLPLL